MIRTRFAPSPTGYMHIGNLRSALFEYLTAKSQNGTFILRIEDTDTQRYVEGATQIIYDTLKTMGISYDEGPEVGGDYGPYIQSERKGNYLKYAEELVDKGAAYYCFCDKERLDSFGEFEKYDRKCANLSKDNVADMQVNNMPYVIRQLIPSGKTEFFDEVYGSITISNDELDDQVLIKSDGMPTYNFANVVDDHLMKITHVIRGNEYISSTPKYNLLYDAFGWDKPTYIHLPLVLNENHEKLSKRKGDKTVDELLKMGYLPEAIINFIALLGWSPEENREIFSLAELITAFKPKNISKSPSVFDIRKLTWMNGEYIKKLDEDGFYSLVHPYLKQAITCSDIDLRQLSPMLQQRVELPGDVCDLVDFIDRLPDYDSELYVHKKMKTDKQNSLDSLKMVLPVINAMDNFDLESIQNKIKELIEQMGIKNGQMLWPIRTALSGKPASFCGAYELLELLGKDESIARIEKGIKLLEE